MKRFIVLFLVCVLAASCGGGRRGGAGGEVVVFDNKANYPACELTLGEIADIEFIRIGKSDDFLMSGRGSAKGGDTWVGKKFIIKSDNGQLFMFDRNGTPIRKIGTQGRGPQEYPWLQFFVGVDEKLAEVYIYGGNQKLLVYGLDGGFKRSIDTETRGFLSGMQLLNDEEIICLQKMGDGDIYTISRQNGKRVRQLPVSFTLPYAHDPDGRMDYPNMLMNEDGMTLFELRTDTIYRVPVRGEITSSIVDVTKYPSPAELYGPDNAQFLPLFETGEHIIGHVLCSPWITPDVKEKHYVYDKKQGQWFSLGEVDAWSGYDAMKGKIAFSRTTRTLNPGYAVWYLQPVRLLENRDKWQSAELEAVLEGVSEDDNPIMMLVKFK